MEKSPRFVPGGWVFYLFIFFTPCANDIVI